MTDIFRDYTEKKLSFTYAKTKMLDKLTSKDG